MAAKCAFGQLILNDLWEPLYPFGTDLEARYIYIEDNDQQWLLATFDFCNTFRRTSRRFRELISKATGIPVESIWTHDLQNHTGPEPLELDGEVCEKLATASIHVIRKMMGETRAVEISHMSHLQNLCGRRGSRPSIEQKRAYFSGFGGAGSIPTVFRREFCKRLI